MSRIRVIVSATSIAIFTLLIVAFPAVSAAAVETPPEPATTNAATLCPTGFAPVNQRCVAAKDPSDQPSQEGWVPLDAGPSTEERLMQRVEELAFQRNAAWFGFAVMSIGVAILGSALEKAKKKDTQASSFTNL